MNSRIAKRDEQDAQEEPRASSDHGVGDESDAALTPEEERGIIEAMASIEAGQGLPFEEVMQELENFEDL